MPSNNRPLFLECGDPQSESATFSRYVFPFAYYPQKITNSRGRGQKSKEIAAVYRECLNEKTNKWLQARMEYFTPEVRAVLFERAKWLEIDPDAWSRTTWAGSVGIRCRNEKTISVSMLPPRIILFEWPKDKDGTNPDMLQTGFLLLDLYFPKPDEAKDARPELDDLLTINDLFRYFQRPYDDLAKKYEKALAEVPTSYEFTSGEHEASKIGSSTNYQEKYLYRWTRLLAFPVEIGTSCWRLLPPSFYEQKKNEPNQKDLEATLPYADQRAYVWSAAIMEHGAKSLSWFQNTGQWRAHKFGHWIRLLNVDSPTTDCPTKTHGDVMQFERQWAKARTYHRWEESGTWYGFNYHSGVMLGPTTHDRQKIPFWRHFRQMYFDIALLLLYIRVSLFRFSRRLTELAEEPDMYDKESCKSLEKLRGTFSIFTIRYQFPLLSNQQQAIEMYALARKHFDIDDLYREVKEEIDNTHEFIETVRQRKLGEAATKAASMANFIAKYGLPIGAGALVASIFGMNAKDYPLADWIRIYFTTPLVSFGHRMTSVSFLILTGLVGVTFIVAWIIIWFKEKRELKDE